MLFSGVVQDITEFKREESGKGTCRIQNRLVYPILNKKNMFKGEVEAEEVAVEAVVDIRNQMNLNTQEFRINHLLIWMTNLLLMRMAMKTTLTKQA